MIFNHSEEPKSFLKLIFTNNNYFPLPGRMFPMYVLGIQQYLFACLGHLTWPIPHPLRSPGFKNTTIILLSMHKQKFTLHLDFLLSFTPNPHHLLLYATFCFLNII